MMFNNATSYTELLVIANNITGGWLVFSIVVSFALVLFVYNLPYGKWRAMVSSTFLTGLLILMFNMAGMIQFWVITLDLFLFVLGLFMMIQSKEGG